MPIADVESHRTLTGRPVHLRRSERTRWYEEYSEFLICLVVIVRSKRCEDLTSLCLWHRNAALKRTTLGEKRERKRGERKIEARNL